MSTWAESYPVCFSSAGLVEIRAGVLGNYWSEPLGKRIETGWDVLVDDILEYKPGMDLIDYQPLNRLGITATGCCLCPLSMPGEKFLEIPS